MKTRRKWPTEPNTNALKKGEENTSTPASSADRNVNVAKCREPLRTWRLRTSEKKQYLLDT